MAVHMETGTMVSPGYKSRTLAHLGLVAGMYEELGIGEVIDRAVPQDEERRFVSVGQAVKAMVLNGLLINGSIGYRIFSRTSRLSGCLGRALALSTSMTM
jgi:hypothetical protein